MSNLLTDTITDLEFKQLINFAVFDGAITGCQFFEEAGKELCLITTIQLNKLTLEHPQTLKDDVFTVENAKAYLVGLLRGRINGSITNLAFDLDSGWHRINK